MEKMIEKKLLFPTIRFNDFKEEWVEKSYSQIFSFYSTNSFSRDNLNYENGEVKNIHYGDIHTKFSMLFNIENELVPYINQETDISKIKEENYCQEGDLVIADASEDYNDIGKSIELVNLNHEKVLAGLHTFLARPNKHKMQLGFSGYLIQSWKVRKQIMTIAQGTKVLGLATTRLGKVKLTIPQRPEQQKIASFLTAIDSKLQQLNTKKSLLEQYKMGVMQQLFSQGLRFKDDDGRDYPKWEKKKLRSLIDFSNGKGHEQIIDEKGKFVVVNSKFISTDGKVQKYCKSQISPLSKGDIVMVMSDVPNGKALAKCYLIEKNNLYTLNQRICALKENNNINEFLIYLINRNKYYLSFDSGVGQTNLKKDEVLDCPLIVPVSIKEQQKIANYLSAIDSKIECVNQQIEKAQSFKKGLLQGMFV